MDVQVFTIRGIFGQAWELFKPYMPFLIGFQLIILLLEIIAGAKMAYFGHAAFSFGLVYLLLHVLISIATIGYCKSFLMIIDGVKPTFDQLFTNWRLVIYWIIASIIFSIILGVGLILFIIPGLIWLCKFGLYFFAMADKGLGPIESLKKSSQITMGHKWSIFYLFIACFLINLLGLLAFGVGILFTSPLTLMAIALAYRKLNVT